MRAIRMMGYGAALALLAVAKVVAYCFALVASLAMVVCVGCVVFDLFGLLMRPSERLATAAAMMGVYAGLCFFAAALALYIPGRLGDLLAIRRRRAVLERIGRLRLDPAGRGVRTRDASFSEAAGA